MRLTENELQVFDAVLTAGEALGSRTAGCLTRQLGALGRCDMSQQQMAGILRSMQKKGVVALTGPEGRRYACPTEAGLAWYDRELAAARMKLADEKMLQGAS